MGLADSNLQSIKTVLFHISEEARKAGWVRLQSTWVCPKCLKLES